MNVALCIIDMQHDFLHNTFPHKQQIVDNIENLLKLFRDTSHPIIHVRTSVSRDKDQRMPHWKEQQKWMCEIETPGHTFAISTRPQEQVVDKVFFSAFSAPLFCDKLKIYDTVVIAGVHTHSCIRATAIEAYERGYNTYIAEEAIASYDPVHAAITHEYLNTRSMRFVSHQEIASILQKNSNVNHNTDHVPVAYIGQQKIECETHTKYIHYSPTESDQKLYAVPIAINEVKLATQQCKDAQYSWRTNRLRVEALRNFVDLYTKEIDTLTRMMVDDVGKPISSAKVEAKRSVDLMLAALENDTSYKECSNRTKIRYCPLGTVAIITPWNNPVGIPLGKIIPALFYGNTVVWKPSPQGTRIAYHIMDIFRRSKIPNNVINIISGDHTTSREIILDENIDALTISGSVATGHTVRALCAMRGIPLQAELGGNNATIVWQDSCNEEIAAKIVAAAFDFAGQRCTATSRVIVLENNYEHFYSLLKSQTKKLNFGLPHQQNTQIGPMISQKAQKAIESVIKRAETKEIWQLPYNKQQLKSGAYFPPTIVCCENSQCEIVQQENFAPVLVVQKAQDWKHAIQLCNEVPQGLAAALFCSQQNLQQQFLESVQAGMLKINCPTTDVECHTPFAGWKSSAIGPPEHGEGNREFYTKRQSIYY
ncbi:aldehyde dehydrogenase family protein [Candidatus Uabimicrobium sp. HlEnr_7]|uniref:aldehyde dehydrogenase family protein n=1 Tax=Candidatus Uabimicrobium helgolandensis TaxID=3095367 RepID=UPI003557BCFC